MADRTVVHLSDGRVGRIVRVDTEFPKGSTTVTVWADGTDGPGVMKVGLEELILEPALSA